MSADNAAPKGNNRLIWQIIAGLILGSIIGQIAHSAQSGFMNSVIGITGIFGSLFVGALKGIAPFLVFILVTAAITKQNGQTKTNMRPILFLYLLGTFGAALVAVIASPKSGKPEWEQELSAGCSAYAIQLAAKAQGFDSVWLTGMWVHSSLLKQAFACGEKEKIIGLVLLGTAECEPSAAKNTDVSAFTQFW